MTENQMDMVAELICVGESLTEKESNFIENLSYEIMENELTDDQDKFLNDIYNERVE